MSKDSGRGIQSIEVGNRLLVALMRSGSPMMLRDLAAEANINAAQAHAYLTSFRRVDLVEQEPSSGRYILGPATTKLGNARMATYGPMAKANEVAADFAHANRVTLALLVWGPTAPTVYRVHDSHQVVNTNLRPGTTFGLLTSAAGRIFAAFDESAPVRQRMRDEIEAHSRVTGRAVDALTSELDAEFANVRDLGFSALSDNPVPGLTSIAVPFLDRGNLVLVAMAIGPTQVLAAEGIGSPRAALLNLSNRGNY